MIGITRGRVAVTVGLLVGAVFAACASPEEAAKATPTAVATQVVGAAATPTAAASATPAGPQKTVLGLLLNQPTPTPRPSATALPPGATPAPTPAPRVAPASYKESVGDFYFYVENLTSSAVTEFNSKFSASCVQNTLFPRGSKAVWRIEVLDVKSGRRIMPDDGTIQVKLPHGENLNARWSQRGGGRTEGAPWMWATAWTVPMDYTLGTLDYEVVVAMKDGRTASWRMPYSGTKMTIVE